MVVLLDVLKVVVNVVVVEWLVANVVVVDLLVENGVVVECDVVCDVW